MRVPLAHSILAHGGPSPPHATTGRVSGNCWALVLGLAIFQPPRYDPEYTDFFDLPQLSLFQATRSGLRKARHGSSCAIPYKHVTGLVGFQRDRISCLKTVERAVNAVVRGFPSGKVDVQVLHPEDRVAAFCVFLGFTFGDAELAAAQAPPFELARVGKWIIPPIDQRQSLARSRHRHVVETTLLLVEAVSRFRSVVGAPPFPPSGEHRDMGELQPLRCMHGTNQHPVADDL